MKPQETTGRETPDKATFSTLEELLPKIVYQLNSHPTSVIGYGELLLPKLADPGRHEGSEITTASDAQTALYLIESQAFDFVVCDLCMPETSGMQLYSILLEKEPSLKDRLIFITGDVLNHEAKSFIDSVSCPYLEKPFPFSSLKEILIKFKKTTRDQRISMK